MASLRLPVFNVVKALQKIFNRCESIFHISDSSLSPLTDESATMRELACAIAMKMLFLSFDLCVKCCHRFESFFAAFTPTSSSHHINKAICTQLLMPFSLLNNPFSSIVNSHRSNRKVFSDEKTGNMQSLSSVKQTFLVSFLMAKNRKVLIGIPRISLPSFPSPSRSQPQDMFL